jgi:hypothetical protein
MRSRLVNMPRLGKVGDGLSKLQGQKSICQLEIESIRYYSICKHKIPRSSNEIYRCTKTSIGGVARRSNIELVMGIITWQRTTMTKRKSLRESILVGRSNKGIRVWLQYNHGTREYLRV